MVNLIQNNAYRILGLDTNTSQKLILKRAKEIINRLKIDDIPGYDLDIHLSRKFRTENSVNDALKKLQSTKEALKEYFFWLQISDTIDEKALAEIKKENYQKAINIWKKASDGKNSNIYFYKKNLAILYSLLMFYGYNTKCLKSSLSIWHEIINSDKFWTSFSKKYKIFNEQTANSKQIIKLKDNVREYLSEVYTDLSHVQKEDDYIKKFQEKFNIQGKKIKKEVMNPVFEEIYEDIKVLNQISLREFPKENKSKCDNCGTTNTKKFLHFEDNSVLCFECDKIIGDEWQEGILRIMKHVNSIIKSVTKLEKKGLESNSESNIIKDKAAKSINQVAVSLHNDNHKIDECIILIKTAIKLCGTKVCKDELSKGLEIVKKNKKHDEKNFMDVIIPGVFSEGKITFRGHFAEYGHKKVYYKDVVAASFSAVAGEYNTKFHFFISSNKESIDLSFTAVLGIKSGEKEEAWRQMVAILMEYMEPHLIKNIVKEIFDQKKTIYIGNLEIDGEGYHKKGFWSGTKSVLWDDPIYPPQMKSGEVMVFNEKNGSVRVFETMSLNETNACALPNLMKACLDEYTLRHLEL
jgi:tetratricopeptide (TPR) repeat protein